MATLSGYFGRSITMPVGWPLHPVRAAVERLRGGAAPDSDRAAILIVDDEADARDFLRTALGVAGYDCLEASSGAQALMLIEQRRPSLVIVDIMMPGMTGIELCSQLRDRRDTWHIPIIVYSAYPMQTTHWGLYERSFVKPADVDDLLGAINGLIEPRKA
jgi:CheY-like chemotaxis protein